VANREHATVTSVAVEAHLPHYGATAGEVEEERLVEEQAARRRLAAALAYADEQGVTLAIAMRSRSPSRSAPWFMEAYSRPCVVSGMR
jgi:hypothetical protein